MAKIYWRTIKRGSRDFYTIPESMKPQVKILAKKDVRDNVISADDYKRLIGEDYVAE